MASPCSPPEALSASSRRRSGLLNGSGAAAPHPRTDELQCVPSVTTRESSPIATVYPTERKVNINKLAAQLAPVRQPQTGRVEQLALMLGQKVTMEAKCHRFPVGERLKITFAVSLNGLRLNVRRSAKLTLTRQQLQATIGRTSPLWSG